MKTVLSVVLLATVLVHSQPAPAGDTPFVYPEAPAWPGGGSMHFQRQRLAILRTAADRLRRFPDSPHTVAWLSQARRFDDALAVLERMVERHPQRLAEGLRAFDTGELGRDQTRGYRERARAIVAAAQKQLEALSREQAAEVALALIPFQQVTDDQREEYGVRVDRVLAAYGGTEAARLMEVEQVLRGRPTQARLSAFDAIAEAAPGTVVAAKARYFKAFQLARNWSNFVLDGANPDPADAFLELLAIVDDLGSGRYPACTWVDQAPELVTGYSMFRPAISPANAERMLNGIRRFVRGHLGMFDASRSSNQLSFLVTSLMPKIARFTENGAATMERLFEAFEREWPDPALAQMMRASWLDADELGFSEPPALPPPSATREADIRALLAAASASPTEAVARQALARLAEREFTDPTSLASAHAHYVEYGRRFPRAPDAWVAALRVGQVEQAQGRPGDAARRFALAAASYGDDDFARGLALAYAGRASEAHGDFDAALLRYRAALGAWPPELADALSLDVPISRTATRASFGNPLAVNRWAVPRADVERRVEEMTESLAVAGGAELERGRWLMAEGQPAEAAAVFEAVARRYAGNIVGREAGVILRRARLDAAVASAAGPADDVAAALADLDALARERFDATSATAGLVAATVRRLRGGGAEVDRAITGVLARWVVEGSRRDAPPPAGTLEADTLAVRDAVFLPLGHRLFSRGWNAASFPAALPAFVVAPARVTVKTADGNASDVDVSRQPPGMTNVVFIAAGDERYLTRTVSRLGGIARREPTAVMQVPNQPVGDARAIVDWWSRFFPARPGHWSGFEILTYPAFRSIEFTNAARTRALVPIAVGYSGATVVLEKTDGVWTMKELANPWIM